MGHLCLCVWFLSSRVTDLFFLNHLLLQLYMHINFDVRVACRMGSCLKSEQSLMPYMLVLWWKLKISNNLPFSTVELYEKTYNGEKVIYWEVKYPFPLSNRDVSFNAFCFHCIFCHLVIQGS